MGTVPAQLFVNVTVSGKMRANSGKTGLVFFACGNILSIVGSYYTPIPGYWYRRIYNLPGARGQDKSAHERGSTINDKTN